MKKIWGIVDTTNVDYYLSDDKWSQTIARYRYKYKTKIEYDTNSYCIYIAASVSAGE